MTLRAKITLWFSVTLTLVTLITVFTVVMAERTLLRQTVKSQLIQTVEENSRELEYFATYQDMLESFGSDRFFPLNEGYVGIDSEFFSQINGIYVSVYSTDGEMLYGKNPFVIDTASTEFKTFSVRTVESESGKCYVFDYKITPLGGEEVLWLRGTSLVDARKGETNQLLRVVLIILPSLILIAVLGGYIITRRTLKPAEIMAKTVSEISGGDDLKRRVKTYGGKDEVQRLADSFNNMMDRLESSFEKEKQFTSDVSHELRTPVAVISAQCDLALEEERSIDEYVEALTTVRRQSGRMSRMISDMLDFARLERNTENFDMEQTDFSAVVSSVCEEQKLIDEKNITLTAEIQQGVTALGNDRLLSRLVTNLISNAYRYGKEQGNINVTLFSTENSIKLTVADDGVGISKENLDKIFDRFFRADKSRTGKGTGLGLPIAREIARLHGGDISVKSELNQGSEFTVKFPKK